MPDLMTIRHILVIRDDHIGDLICSTPAIECLKKACPNAEITLLASTYNAAIAEGNPNIDKILRYEKHKHRDGKSRFFSTWRQFLLLKSLRKTDFDLAIGLRSRFSRRQAQAAYASGAQYRLGHFPDNPDFSHLDFLYNIYVHGENREKHEIERVVDILKPIGIENTLPRPLVVIDSASKDFAAQKIISKKISGSPVIGYHISNRNPLQCWPLSAFSGLIKHFREIYPSSEHLITFAPDDRAKAEQLLSMTSGNCHIIFTNEIKQVGAIQLHCDLFITLDGAPNHLSSALNVPTLTLFGMSDPVVWAPWGLKHRYIRKESDIASISPEEVFNVACEMLVV